MPGDRVLNAVFRQCALVAFLSLSLAFFAQDVPGQQTPPAVSGGQADRGPLPPRNRFVVELASSAVRLDGVLDEEAWEKATVIPLVREWFPSYNAEPPVATECLVTFDNENLYVAFRAHDPDPAQIRAHLADRDTTAFIDDFVGFYIDTFDDRRRAFEFRVNALGVQTDAIVSDLDASEDFSWDAIWGSVGKITAEGYVVEIAVPFKQLYFPRGAEVQTWGFLASRNYPRSVVHELRSTHSDQGKTCLVCQFDTLTGFRQIDTGQNLEVIPTVTAHRTDERQDLLSPLEEGEEKAEAGLSTRWGITPNMTFNVTLNPDFSQVEADAMQLSVNERFALSFPEKRPFFLEGADFYTTPFRAVFTRTVADPAAGVKLTGKEGNNAFGVFLTEDRINNLIFPGAEGSGFASLTEKVRSGVVRYRRDVGKTSTLGVLYAGREGDAYTNQVYGVDGALRVTDADIIRFQALDSRTEYPVKVAVDHGQPQEPFSGEGWQMKYRHSTRDWSWELGYLSLDPGFRADSGFIPQVDYRQSYAEMARSFWGPPGGWFSRLQLIANAFKIETLDGDPIERRGALFLIYQGPLQSSVRLVLRPIQETFRGVTYDSFREDLRITVRPNGDFGFEIFLAGGETIDFVNARQVKFMQVEPRFELKLSRSFSGELQHFLQAFEVESERYLKANLTRATLRYHLNVRAFFRAVLQYRDVERDLTLYNPGIQIAPREKELSSQLLFSYKLNPQTVLLLGYSDFSEGDQTIDLTQSNRAFFLKLGYAWLQ